MKTKYGIILCLIAFFCIGEMAYGQSRAEKKRIQQAQERVLEGQIGQLLGTKQFYFIPTQMVKSGITGGSVADAWVHVKKDTVSADLPFFGSSSLAEFDKVTGILFKSTEFDYDIKPKRKGGWDLRINTNDKHQRFQYRLFFNITKSGFATLTVTQPYRDSQTFQGYLVSEIPK